MKMCLAFGAISTILLAAVAAAAVPLAPLLPRDHGNLPVPFANFGPTAADAKIRDVFAVGDGGLVLHFDGTSWLPMTSGVTDGLNGLWARASNDVYAAGSSGRIIHYDGTSWSTMTSPVVDFLYGIWGPRGERDVFIVGNNGIILRYDGSSWSSQTSNTTELLYGLWGSDLYDVFAVGNNGTVVHYDGSTWTAQQAGAGDALRGIWGFGTDDVWACGGSGRIYHFDGITWSAPDIVGSSWLWGLWGAAPSDLWVCGFAGFLAHYDGTDWTEVSSGTAADLYDIWGFSGDDIYATGTSGTILHYDGSSWQAQTSGTGSLIWQVAGPWASPADTLFADDFGPAPAGNGLAGRVLSLVEYDGELIAGGEFTSAGGVAVNNIAAYDGNSWHALGGGLDGTVFRLLEYEGQLIAAGQFAQMSQVGMDTIISVAAWNGSTWSKLGRGLTNYDGSPGQVYALVVWNDQLVAGGAFDYSGGVYMRGVAAWNGSAWEPLTADTNGMVLDLCVYEGDLILGGLFDYSWGGVMRWDGSSFSGFGPSFLDGWIFDVEVYSGELYAGGVFMSLDGIIRWDGSAWQKLGTGLRPDTDNVGVARMFVYDGSLLAMGAFERAGDQLSANVALWDGSSWQSLGGGCNDEVYAAAVSDDLLYIGGAFTVAGVVPSYGIARWDEAPQPPAVSFTAPSGVTPGLPLVFQADIQDNHTVQGAMLHYRQGGAGSFVPLPMSPVTGKDGGYTATVPGGSVTLFGVEYYISATDGSQTTYEPPSAPAQPGFQAVTVAGQALAPGDTARYRLIGFPFVTSGGLAAVFEDDLGAYDRSQWRLGRWNPASQSYQEYPNVAALTPGRGYWLIQRDPRAVDANGLTTNSATGVAVTLEPGWNMIAGPYFFDVAWSDVVAENGGAVMTAIEDPIGRSGTTYMTSGTLAPWQGYFVYNGGATRTITLPGVQMTKSGPVEVESTVAAEGAWSIQVDATCGRRAERGLELGVSPAALDGLDGLDRHDPPALPGDVDLSLLLAVDGVSHHLRRDVRGPLGAGQTWELVLQAAAGDGPVSLEFGGLAQVPAELEVRLLGIGGEHDLRAASQVSLDAGDGGAQHLLLAVGEPDYVEGARQEVDRLPRPFGLAQNYPNPFNPQTQLGFGLAERSWVRLVVYDVRGRQVRRLLDEVRGPGQHWVSWDGRDDGGAAVAAGVYFAAIQAGKQTATRKMVLVR